jgi:hypothetical protein
VDILDFLARSEWPLVAGVALWLIRAPLIRMLDRVNPTKVDAWGFKAEFERTLTKVEALTPASEEEEKAALSALEGKGASEPLPPPPPPREPTALAPPEVTILESWRRIESLMRQMSDAQHPRISARFWNPPRKIDEAARELGLSDDEIAALMELRKLRNQVAHSIDAPVTPEDAARFQIVTERLLGRMVEGPKRAG